MSGEINTTNDSFIGMQGDRVVMLIARRSWTREEALRMAAYIVAMADTDNTFDELLKAVKST